MKNKSVPTIAFLGSLPPPFGGFTIGLQRLTARLEENGFGYVVYDLLNKRKILPGGVSTKIRSRFWWLLRYVFLAREDLICCHYVDWRLRTAIGLMTLMGKKTLISIGGTSLNDSLEKGNWFKKKMIAFSLKHYSFVIAHNLVIRQLCLSQGVKKDRIEIIPAFIPPILREDDFSLIPRDVWDFMKIHQPVISANAFRINFYNNQDDYGIDMCVEVCANLKSIYPQVGFVFCLPHIGDDNYFSKIKQMIRDKNIDENFLFITQPLGEVYPIWQKSDIFVRPTASDGDALSLREALYFKTPSIASNAAPRPAGTIIFRNRDIGDFIDRVKMVWDNYDYYKSKSEAIEVGNGFNKTLEIYSRMVNKQVHTKC
jgi:glycosyltransferase involved in cell wall biosynthesis